MLTSKQLPAAGRWGWIGLGLAAGWLWAAPTLVQAAKAGAPLLAKPAAAYFARFQPRQAPPYPGNYLQPGDRLALCGDSITEQKMYSRIIETYLTVVVPELGISVRQYGWGGETAPGFLARLTNDCLRFHPTLATTCYGMNDHGYRPYEAAIGQRYREASAAIVRACKQAGARVVIGAPGCVGKKPGWSQSKEATAEDLNLNLCELRNIALEIAQAEQVRFADVFWPMLVGGHEAQQRYQPQYAIAGGDGVHPGWAGHLVMAYAFLHSLGLSGDVGTFTVDLKGVTAKVTQGHDLVACRARTNAVEVQVTSHRYPFCAAGDPTRDDQVRSGMTLVPFNQELNRLLLVAKRAKAKQYRVTWGPESHTYTRQQLAQGINLAADFAVNPFSEAFAGVDAAVKAKQEFETVQVKQRFHGPEGQADLEGTVAKTEAGRAPLVQALRNAMVPVTHTLRIEPLGPD